MLNEKFEFKVHLLFQINRPVQILSGGESGRVCKGMFCSADQLPMQPMQVPMQPKATTRPIFLLRHLLTFPPTEDWQGGGEDKKGRIARAKRGYEHLVLSQIPPTTTLQSTHSRQMYKPHKNPFYCSLKNSFANSWWCCTFSLGWEAAQPNKWSRLK